VDVRRLKIQLQRALENEDYEKAAELRDKINSLNQ
jgi:protein-arginine kinase activator protein McsA